MMNERGVEVDHTTIFRWVQAYVPEMDKRCRPHLKITNDLWKTDETYIKVKGAWKYLSRAIDFEGNTLDFTLSAKRDTKAAKRFFKKVLKGAWTEMPRVVNVDKNPAYPSAVKDLKAPGAMPEETALRQVKYLNNLIEQDHRFIKQRKNPGLGFGSFSTARRTTRGYKSMNMVRMGQIKDVPKGDIIGQSLFIHKIFRLGAKLPDQKKNSCTVIVTAVCSHKDNPNLTRITWQDYSGGLGVAESSLMTLQTAVITKKPLP